MSSKAYKDKPLEVWFVERIPSPTERIPYYGRQLKRLYQDKRGVVQFIAAHTRDLSDFKIYKGTVSWEEVKRDDI